MPVLRSLDLFSGIGGMTHALRGLARPVAYCEVEPFAQDVLRANMRRKWLPTAPICPDVRALDAAWLKAQGVRAADVDLITAGFPCTGMSIAGPKDGFKNPETRLFYELLRIVDVTRPKLILLENSPHIVAMGRKGVGEVLAQLHKRGYEVRYMTYRASDAGAPHHRNRWYCVALLPSLIGTALRVSGGAAGTKLAPHGWTRPPARTVPTKPPTWKGQMHGLGMAVVPDVVRIACVYLLGASNDPWGASVKVEDAVSRDGGVVNGGAPYPDAGVMHIRAAAGAVRPIDALKLGRARDYKVVLDPNAYKTSKPPSSQATSGFITHVIHNTHWGTPIPNHTWPSNYLTERNCRMLNVQIRFERSTLHREHPASTQFVEWMMGYPTKWTAAT